MLFSRDLDIIPTQININLANWGVLNNILVAHVESCITSEMSNVSLLAIGGVDCKLYYNNVLGTSESPTQNRGIEITELYGIPNTLVTDRSCN